MHVHTQPSDDKRPKEMLHESELSELQKEMDDAIPELYDKLFFIGDDGRPMLDLGYLTKLRDAGLPVPQPGPNPDPDPESEDDEEDLASSINEITGKANLQDWQKHMTWCNRSLKKEVGKLEKIMQQAEKGMLVPPELPAQDVCHPPLFLLRAQEMSKRTCSSSCSTLRPIV